MKKNEEVRVEGIATLSENSFHFNSGLPQDEPLLDQEIRLRGELHVFQNGTALFHRRTPVSLPPEVHQVSQGMGYYLKRTSRNYIIHIKVPVMETRRDTQSTLDALMPTIMGDITLDRRELMEDLELNS